MRAVALLLFLCAGCSGDGERAEKRYKMASAGASAAERCRLAGNVAEAYLSDQNEAKFKEWRSQRDTECQAAHGPFSAL